jgi:hypothetical protein
MCTVTLIPLPCSGEERAGVPIRMVCNRDEQRTRPAALPPVVRPNGDRVAVYPVDPVGDGTWAAINDAGLLFALLNWNPIPRSEEEIERLIAQMRWEPSSSAVRPSRGRIIPQLLRCGTLEEVLADAVKYLPHNGYAPFRLVVAGSEELVEIHCADADVQIGPRMRLTEPLLFCSSGLGDAVVDAPRRELFNETVAPAADRIAVQDAFHRSQWTGREDVSVCMSRRLARTVSMTVMTRRAAAVELSYFGDSPDRAMDGETRILEIPSRFRN